MIKSFFFLLGLYYLRHIPIATFWGLYSLCYFKGRPKINLILSFIFIAAAYGIGFLLLLSIMTFALNLLIFYDFQSTVLPILLTEEILVIGDLKAMDSKYFTLLLARLVYLKRFALPLKFILRIFEFLALILIGVGLIDFINDLASHENPDLFDFLFPFNGALMLYGGIFFLSITSFFLYFIIPPGSIRNWKERLNVSLGLPLWIRYYIISPSLLHPYFYLTPVGRSLAVKNTVSPKTLTLLLKKALLDNRDRIPEEWLS